MGIFFAIALSVTITVVMEGRSAKAFKRWNDINDDTTVTMVRDGEVTLVSQRDITIGDVLQISTGDKLPADARPSSNRTDLTADESALTGEACRVPKPPTPCLTDPKTLGGRPHEHAVFWLLVTAGNGSCRGHRRGRRRHRVRQDRPAELRAANTGMTPPGRSSRSSAR